MLAVSGLTCGYGDIVAVRDFSFAVEAGEILALLGANGAGKTSTLMTLAGLSELQSGEIRLLGEDISRVPAQHRIGKGMSIVPEGRRVFPDLTVEENLIVGGHSVAKTAMRRNIERALDIFPRLRERLGQYAGSLSGGEQQMLAIGRALISEPRLLLVDELSLGLMPTVIDECYRVIADLRTDGLAIILVDQNTERALDVADRVCILEAGSLVWTGTAAQARRDDTLAASFLGQTPEG
jgi:branched-chain amino acid transport system ATP-binding protein